MMYLVFKELAGSASDVIMMTQSIIKDTGVGGDVLYKANAIRALCRIIDVGVRGTLQAVLVLIICRRLRFKRLKDLSRLP